MNERCVLLPVAILIVVSSVVASCRSAPTFKDAFKDQEKIETGEAYYIRMSQFEELVRSGKLRPGLSEKEVLEILGEPSYRGKPLVVPDASDAKKAKLDRLTELTYALGPASSLVITINENGRYLGYFIHRDGW